MSSKTIFQEAVEAQRDQLLHRIKSYLSSRLEKEIRPEEILSEAICYFLEHPKGIENRSELDIQRLILWKSRRLVWDKVRNLKRESRKQDEYVTIFSNTPAGARFIAPSPTLVLHREAKTLNLRRLIGLIPNRNQREALWLTKVEGLSIDDAARHMGRPPASTRKLMERGFQNLILIFRSGGVQTESSGLTS